MCGRFVLVKIEIDGGYIWTKVWVGQEEFQDKAWFKKVVEGVRERYDIRPTQDVVIMKLEPKSKKVEMPRARWGFQVPWMKAPLINARSESLLESRTWSKAIKERRCIIPATAFYEWQRRTDAEKNVPWEIRRKGGGTFYFAGLWKEHVDETTGLGVFETTIITQPGNDLLRAVHNHGGNAGRQPVFLDNDKIERWLDPDVTNPDDVMSCLRQIENGEWEGRMLTVIGDDKAHHPPIPREQDAFTTNPDAPLSPERPYAKPEPAPRSTSTRKAQKKSAKKKGDDSDLFT